MNIKIKVMDKIKIKIAIAYITTGLCLWGAQNAIAGVNIGQPVRKSTTSNPNQDKRLLSGCDPATANIDLDVNNVRARILNGGDMWWDLVATAKYEIPKVTTANGVHRCSLFAGALWLGGYDNTNLRLAAMTYRQNGSDFFPGPLDTSSGNTSSDECQRWDKIFEVTRQDVDNFKNNSGQAPPTNILQWPGTGDPSKGEAHSLAPFVNVSNSGYYNPSAGDYPDVPGDQNLWFIFNDRGNIHSESKADPIGVEVKTLAFAFATNDQINDMTFYKHVITNRGSTTLTKTYFGQWVDPDLGYAFDDYVGCDSTRNLGFDYNGEDVDPGVTGYGANPPSVGVEFFEGPFADPGPGVIPGVTRLGMSKFMYYNNDFSVQGNPTEAIHYYNYLDGRWTNGKQLQKGGNGYSSSGGPANFMFPGDPQTCIGWSEKCANNPPGDRRFIESSGTFTLLPGAVNNITTGVVWARTNSGGAVGSLSLLKLASDYAKELYINNFALISGPDAPTMTVQELDKKIILTLTNTNNPTDNIEGFDTTYKNSNGNRVDYKFEGYQIFQLANSTVGGADLNDPDKARQVAEVDLRNNVTVLINRDPDQATGAGTYTYTQEVNGVDSGIRHSFVINSDAFSNTGSGLINFQFYYFMVVAYARNVNYLGEFDSLAGPGHQYLASRKTILANNLVVYQAIPHDPTPEFGGIQLNSTYGSGPEITRIEGTGNGGNNTDLTDSTINKILELNYDPTPTYTIGRGPVNIKVIDPLSVQNANYVMYFIDTTKTFKSGLLDRQGRWEIYDVKDMAHPVKSDDQIGNGNEQIIPQWGLSVTVNQSFYPTDSPVVDAKNGLLDATMTFTDDNNHWLTGIQSSAPVPDLSTQDIPTISAWIRAGSVGNTATGTGANAWKMETDDAAIPITITSSGGTQTSVYQFLDPQAVYLNILGGIIGPAALVARSAQTSGGYFTMGPMYQNLPYTSPQARSTPSIDLVFTSDKTKWTQGVVLEMSEASGLAEGGARKFDARRHASWTGNADASGNPIYDNTDSGRSWFPGYAINIETGERLNIMFGEDSHDINDNGRDMIWNPTSNYANPATSSTDIFYYLWGGKHWIYVMNSRSASINKNASFWGNSNAGIGYDGGKIYQSALLAGRKYYSGGSVPNPQYYDAIFNSAAWIMGPLLMPNHSLASLNDGIIPTDVKIRLRVSKPYETFDMNAQAGGTELNNAIPYYTFSTSGIAAKTNNIAAGKTAIDKVGVVPNPYYAYDFYETSQIDNRVRIINLPSTCTISIYTLNGSLVRQYSHAGVGNAGNSDAQETYLDWDLKNQAGIPIAGGVYIIYVDGGALGTKVIKWFGVLRPIDLDTF